MTHAPPMPPLPRPDPHADVRPAPAPPERAAPSPPAPPTGAQYLQSLRDGRVVYLNGERVPDVSAHSGLRNAARSIARLYDALRDPRYQDELTCPTDTGSGGITHRSFRASRSRDDLVRAQQAIARWARLTYGWMGRTPDYKASLTTTFGPAADFYGPYASNARAWYARAQESALFLSHAIVNPPVDKSAPVDELKDVCVHARRETSAGIIVSGAKVVATSAALTRATFVGQAPGAACEDPSMALAFIVPLSSPGVSLICRSSYEGAAHRASSPFDQPLSSRFDENDSILVLEDVLVPWESVLIYRDPERVRGFFTGSGFLNGFLFQGCTRLAVKLDFIAGALSRALRAMGAAEARSNRAALGEVIALGHTFWSLSNAMAHNPDPWHDGAVLPERRAALAYSVLAPDAYARALDLVQRAVSSGLIYLPSSARDLQSADVGPLLGRYVRGSGGMDHTQRIKVMKLLWDAVGTEFAGRHALYERCYAGGQEGVRLQVEAEAQRSRRIEDLHDLVDACMSEYDQDGWTSDAWLNPGDEP